jgi:hypothetical protein
MRLGRWTAEGGCPHRCIGNGGMRVLPSLNLQLGSRFPHGSTGEIKLPQFLHSNLAPV